VSRRQAWICGCVVQSLEVTDPTKVAGLLLARLNAYRAAQAPADDLTYLLLHHNAGSSPRLTLGQTLSVDAKLLGLKKV
jgi:hypothetical protein